MKKVALHLQIFLCITLGLLTGCITPYEPEEMELQSNILVVEGSIIAPYGTEIKLSRIRPITSSDTNESNFPTFENATVTIITDDGQTVAQAEAVTGETSYKVKDSLSFLSGKKYAIHIKLNNKEYQSKFVEPQITPEIDEVKYLYKELQQVDIQVSTHNDRPNSSCYYRWKYEEDWEIRSEYFSPFVWEDNQLKQLQLASPNNLYYCWINDISKNFILGSTMQVQENRIKDHTILSIPRYNNRLSYLYSILVKQYSLDKDAFDYFQNLQKNIDQTGGLFAPQPSEIKGNITCLTNPDEVVIGYINATTETSYRLYLKAYELAGMSDVYDCREQVPYSYDQLKNAYNQGHGILKETTSGYICINIRCVDCTMRGGTKNKPAFWPNDHQ